MNIFKKDNLKELVIISVTAIVVISIISIVFCKIQYKALTYEFNIEIEAIISDLIKKYPEEEVNIITGLKKEDKINSDGIFKKYGINMEENSAIKSIDKQLDFYLVTNITIIIGSAVLLFIIFIVYLYKKDRKIEKILKYLEHIQQKRYDLNIEENSESELSNLQNEIYKITIMLKEQALKSEKDKKQLADSLSDISHQLKTPLTSISVMIDILKDSKELTEEKRREFINEISRQIDSINWLVIALLKLSKIDSGTIIMKKDEINLNELIKDIEKNLGILLEIKNQKIEINSSETVKLLADRNWIKEALTNIVKNCIEHADEQKTLHISLEKNVLYIQIKIQDEGHGIEKEDIPHIFERFYKGKNSSKDSIGIGLALAKSIIEKNDGEIYANSELGKGTEFVIRFYI